MKLTLLSDIHLEYLKSYQKILSRISHHKHKTDVCILAGDIGHHTKPIYSDFLGEIKKIFKDVIVIPGNHEYLVRKEIYKIDEEINDICFRNKCIFLNKSTVKINGIKFIGCTLWSDIGLPSTNINLKNQMYSNTIWQNLYDDHLRWLQLELDKNEKSVVITHHCPTFKLRHEYYNLTEGSKYFYSHLDHLIKDPIKLWLCGHSHRANNIIINNIPIIMNPIGYNNEASLWNDSMIIDVD